mmetsp:Transcript_17058/g.35874  ORF Transcript_17058/g.35874 Transcript_17058/m.35874 type:complete len:209 (-) Transcript_17058:978-1604(-)
MGGDPRRRLSRTLGMSFVFLVPLLALLGANVYKIFSFERSLHSDALFFQLRFQLLQGHGIQILFLQHFVVEPARAAIACVFGEGLKTSEVTAGGGAPNIAFAPHLCHRSNVTALGTGSTVEGVTFFVFLVYIIGGQRIALDDGDGGLTGSETWTISGSRGNVAGVPRIDAFFADVLPIIRGSAGNLLRVGNRLRAVIVLLPRGIRWLT